ncbi:hypothetical protein OG455_27475 [Kitasatospora sp. NBC_01287]|uniref:hypothetical protein n=1 Tax=Kitasatospora sp. NBC_01287 TaxID=2903573 RepID=UPI00224DC764|nr:hypothetical protein [Kitasatospora sp. NBC_01287]MCX4749201.1 hypothetical protein [Kitasatospora sp. NBC_01287]
MTTVLTTDHPAWQTTPTGTTVRALRSGPGLWVASWSTDGLTMTCTDGAEDTKPRTITTDPHTLGGTAPAALRAGLCQVGPGLRIPNPSLWDAITTAVLRQVVRAGQARKVYRAWCATHGTRVDTVHGPLAVAPAPGAVLELADEQFTAVGAKFHRTALQGAARAYLEHADTWQQLAPAELAAALVGVPRIGPWTAAAAAADFSGDFTHYPHADLAVRTWAARIAPEYPWPTADTNKKTEAAFGAHWHDIADDGRQLHTLTLSTLTWGAHAHTDQPGGCPTHRP